MEIVHHRVNDLSMVTTLEAACGTEIDIRSSQEELLLAHDPHSTGPGLDEYLKIYAKTHSNRLLILNPKEDGLENEILALLAHYRIEHFFFLDLTLPTLVRLAVKGKEKRIAVRISEYEPIESAWPFRGLVSWIWLDCFSGKPASSETLEKLRTHFKICAVSPELQGYPPESIETFKTLSPYLDAVCTKYPALWR